MTSRQKINFIPGSQNFYLEMFVEVAIHSVKKCLE